MIELFTKPILKQLRSELETALAPVAERHGIKLSFGNGKFDATSFMLKLNGAVLNGADRPANEAREWARMASAFGLKPTDYDRKVRVDGMEFRMVAFRPRASRPSGGAGSRGRTACRHQPGIRSDVTERRCAMTKHYDGPGAIRRLPGETFA